jgi:hypothetical protein
VHVKDTFEAPVSWDNYLKGFCEDASEHVPTSSDVSAARKCHIYTHLKGKLLPEILYNRQYTEFEEIYKDGATDF